MWHFITELDNINFILIFVTLLCGSRYFYNFLFAELDLINTVLFVYFVSLMILLHYNLDFIGVIFCIIYIGFILVLIIHMIRFFAGYTSIDTVAKYHELLFLFFPFMLYLSNKYSGVYAVGLKPIYVIECDLIKGYESLKIETSDPLLSEVSDYMFSFDGLITLVCVLTLLTATVGVIILSKYGNKK